MANTEQSHGDGHQLGNIALLDVWLSNYKTTWISREASDWRVRIDLVGKQDFHFGMSGDQNYMEAHLESNDGQTGNDLPDGNFCEETWLEIKQAMIEHEDPNLWENVNNIEALTASIDAPPIQWPNDGSYPEHEDF